MADAPEASGSSAPPTEAVAKLLLDEVTGDMVSKSELKKREKNRKKEEEKKAKEAAAPPKPAKKTNAEADEKELNPNVSGQRGRYDIYRGETADGGVIAIFRDSITHHQQTSTNQEPEPISSQVPCQL